MGSLFTGFLQAKQFSKKSDLEFLQTRFNQTNCLNGTTLKDLLVSSFPFPKTLC
jgi:hypothetical protein